jgi:hypothetical protein
VLDVTTAAPVLPTAPSGLAATVLSPTEIKIDWVDASDNELGFRVQRSDFVSSSFKTVAELDANIITYTSTGLVSNSEYWFKVVAYNNDGESAASNTVSAMTTADVPAAPSDVQIFAISKEGFEVQWKDNSDVENSYRVDIRQQGDFSTLAELDANVESFTVTGLEKATTYTVRVAAINDTGESFSDEVSATTADDPPMAPSDLSVSTDDTGTIITLTWVDNSDNEDGFSIERSVDDTENFVEFDEAGTDEIQLMDTIEVDQKVFYRVRSFASGNFSDYSNITGTVISATSLEIEHNFTVYPNPTKGVVNLKFEREAPKSVSVHSYTGQQLKSYEFEGKQKLDIDLSKNHAGLYFFKINFKNNSITKKVLLIR